MLAAILSQLDYLSVLVAAIGGWLFGALWYRLLGGAWAKALGRAGPAAAPPVATMILSFACELLMASALFGIVHHIGEATIERALFSAFMIWLGFVATTLIVNYRFAGRPWRLVLIDGGHWLGVLAVMGLVIGAFGD